MRQCRYGALLCMTLAGLALTIPVSASDSMLEVGPFSRAQPGGDWPPGWRPLTFKKIDSHTRYQLVRDGDTVVVKARASASAAGLVRELSVDAREYPILSWRWKVENILQAGDVHRKDGDDYPARLYITYRYDPQRVSAWERAKYEAAKFFYGVYPPLRSINYIYESHAPVGTIVPNAYTDRVRMIVVRSGRAELGRWIQEERDLYADYRAAFNEEPPQISGIAIMTDTDNTGESATAYYGDIVLKRRAP